MPIVPSGPGSYTPMAAVVEMVVAVELLVDILVVAILAHNTVVVSAAVASAVAVGRTLDRSILRP